MKSQEVRFEYLIHENLDSLSPLDQVLIKKAAEATETAYAPYSQFKVGAAIRTAEGILIAGSNQENGAFPIGQCAERVAIYRLAYEHGRKVINTIAIVVDNENQLTPASPCGSCRQILNEYQSHQSSPIRLLLGIKNGGIIYEISDSNFLLPFAFDGSFLGQ